jgi:hypothetical protein
MMILMSHWQILRNICNESVDFGYPLFVVIRPQLLWAIEKIFADSILLSLQATGII